MAGPSRTGSSDSQYANNNNPPSPAASTSSRAMLSSQRTSRILYDCDAPLPALPGQPQPQPGLASPPSPAPPSYSRVDEVRSGLVRRESALQKARRRLSQMSVSSQAGPSSPEMQPQPQQLQLARSNSVLSIHKDLPRAPGAHSPAPTLPPGAAPASPRGPSRQPSTPASPHAPSRQPSIPASPHAPSRQPSTPTVPRGPGPQPSTPPSPYPSGPSRKPSTPRIITTQPEMPHRQSTASSMSAALPTSDSQGHLVPGGPSDYPAHEPLSRTNSVGESSELKA